MIPKLGCPVPGRGSTANLEAFGPGPPGPAPQGWVGVGEARGRGFGAWRWPHAPALVFVKAAALCGWHGPGLPQPQPADPDWCPPTGLPGGGHGLSPCNTSVQASLLASSLLPQRRPHASRLPSRGHRTHLSQCHTSLDGCQHPSQLLPCPLDSLVRVTPRPLLGAHPEALPVAALEPLTSSGLKLAPHPPGHCFQGDPPPSHPPPPPSSPRGPTGAAASHGAGVRQSSC